MTSDSSAPRAGSARQFDSFVDSIGAILWEADPISLRNTYVSSMAERLLGFPASAWTDEPTFWVDRVHPDDREAACQACFQAMRDMQDCQLEYRMVTKQGRTVWIRDYVSMIVEDGQLVRLRGCMVDVTEQKQTEQALRESEARLRAIVEHTPNVAIQGYDSDGRVCLWNDASARMFGFSAEEALGNTLDKLIHTPEETAVFRQALSEICGSGKVIGPSEFHFRRRNGEHAWCISTIFETLGYQGGPMFVCMDVDITERKKAEESARQSESKMRAIFDQTFQFTGLLTAKGSILEANRSALEFAGCAYSEVAGRPFWETPWWSHSKAEQERLRRGIQRAARGELVRFQTTHPAANGTIREIDFSLKPVRDGSGAILWLIAEGRDITELRRLEDQLRQAQKMEAIGKLAGGIAHDFNNILTAILGNAEFAKLALDPAHRASAAYGNIVYAGLRAKALIQQILAFSSSRPPERRAVPLARLMRESVELIAASLPSGVDLRSRLEDEELTVLADPTQVQQVVLNLLANAWQSLEGNPGRVEIAIDAVRFGAFNPAPREGLEPGSYARIRIADTGKGMDAATLERMYEPFFTTKKQGEGAGLGLSVVHGIVNAHGGAIRAKSELGRGTEFEVFLPLTHAAPEPEPVRPNVARPVTSGGRVLWIDDETMLLDVARQYLPLLGCEPACYSDVNEALAAFAANPMAFSAAFTDLNMPMRSGLQVAREIRRIRADIPIVLCSGNLTKEARGELPGIGIRQVLAKPFTFSELSHCLAGALAGPRGVV